MADLQEFFAEQRAKYERQREEARASLAEAEAELYALDAYEAAKSGRAIAAPPAGERKTRKPRQTGKREEVLNLVAQFPHGVTSGELIEKMEIGADKAGKQSLANALAALKKTGRLQHKDGRYFA